MNNIITPQEVVDICKHGKFKHCFKILCHTHFQTKTNDFWF